jgi:proton-dependent oligopeptide transporter, POT family
VMGSWFLSIAFANMLASVIAKVTAVAHGEEGLQFIPPPKDTVHLYGDLFGVVALTAGGAAVVVFGLAYFLNKWMHPEVTEDEEEGDAEVPIPTPDEAPEPETA